MKIAVLSESPADEAALKILVEAILEQPVEVAVKSVFRARSGGWQSVLGVLAAVIRDAHYQQSADAVVVGIDADNSLVHSISHEQLGGAQQSCRYCEVTRQISDVMRRLTPVPQRAEIKTAVAIPPPAIEAWYLCGRDQSCTEAGWLQRQQTGVRSKTEINKLKQAVYGTDRPPLELETARATEAAERLSAELPAFEQWFPNSFGVFARDVRAWLQE